MDAKKVAAFTLLEVLVATCILSFLLLGLYFIFDKSHSAWEKGNMRLKQYQKVRGCFDTLRGELKSTFTSSSNPSTVFRGSKDEISFTSSSNIPHQKGEYDLKSIHYQLKNSRLIRKVKSNFTTPAGLPATTILACNIDKITFSYYDGKRWQPEWNFKKDSQISHDLPQAVRIKLVIGGKKEEPVTFSTIVNIPLNSPQL